MSEVTTWEQMSELEQLECMYCEMHKDVYGTKARWYRADSVEQARRDLAALQVAADAEFAREQAEQQLAISKFEQLVADTIDMGARDRETALRWIMDGSEAQGDWEYFCYLNGLPYGFFRKVA